MNIDFSEDATENTLDNSIYALGCPFGTAVKCVSLGQAKINKINPNVIISNDLDTESEVY